MKRESTIIAIASGKGGVGKSVVSVNVAEALVAAGHRVALVDADFGQGACALLMNESPAASVLDHVCHRARTEHVKHETAQGVTLVQAVAEAGEADGYVHALYASLDELLDDLRRSHDYILIDTPAGTEGPVRWALDRADLGILVVVGEPTAVADAYRLAKMVWHNDAEYPLGVIVNFADTADEAESVAHRFGTVTASFLAQSPNYLGWVPFSAAVRQSVLRQRPAVRAEGPVAEAFDALAQTLVEGRKAVLHPAA